MRQKLLSTAECPNPLQEFCRAAADLGAPMDEMDLVFAGEEDYAAIRRSTNGGGENSPLLEGSDDYYSMFMAELRGMAPPVRRGAENCCSRSGLIRLLFRVSLRSAHRLTRRRES